MLGQAQKLIVPKKVTPEDEWVRTNRRWEYQLRRRVLAKRTYWSANSTTLDPLKANLKAYWSLDEESGNRRSRIGNYVATDNNTVGYDTGKHNNSASYTIANKEYLEIATSEIDLAALFATSSFSVSWWIKTSYDAGNSACWGTLTSTPTNGVWAWIRPLSNNGIRVTFVNADASMAIQDDVTDMADSAWHFLAVTVNGTTAKLYVDGVLKDTEAGLHAIPDTGLPTSIGYSGQAGYAHRFYEGLIDEFGVFDVPLTVEQVEALHNSGNGAFYVW